MGQAAAMQALQHLTGGGGSSPGGGLASILGGLAGGAGAGGAGAAISSLLGGGSGGGSGPASAGPHPSSAGPGAAAPQAAGGAAGGAPGPAAPTAAPTSPYEKLIAVAMMQASELFDKHGSGDPAAKQQAIQSAASTVMKLMNRYQSGGSSAGAQLQPGEIQGLFSSFMKAFM
ncbi:hypothetical protein CALCODRAFT_359214 [Calocera cornea HHB12733]|uniref:Uncharacterized protein n=1 Tax=Calocera cornea HHB12733 TaxID=1353952 RepID=A0A165ENJ5_9BASI|nr:hypothetical protein CALCODRAFT_359214 [Calocera cornea HHB12733]